ncbi:MAG: hypothetical protein ACYDAP_00410 [Thermoplasmataceae archaeon]
MNIKIFNAIPYLILPLVISFYELITFILGLFFSPQVLAISPLQPNNALSSIFVFDGMGNIYMFLVMTALFSVNLYFLPKKQQYIRAFFVSIAMFGIAVYSELSWLNQGYYLASTGQSGVVYALQGLIITFFIIDGILNFLNHNLLKSFINTIIGLYLIFPFLFVKSTIMFNIKNGVNYYVHEVSFYTGIELGIIFMILCGIFSYISINHINIKEAY